jgi:hypothetical protein
VVDLDLEAVYDPRERRPHMAKKMKVVVIREHERSVVYRDPGERLVDNLQGVRTAVSLLARYPTLARSRKVKAALLEAHGLLDDLLAEMGL